MPSYKWDKNANPQSNLLACPPSDQLQSLTLHDCVSYDYGVSPLVAEECSGSGLVAHTPHWVVDGVLHTAPIGGDVDRQLRGHSVLYWEVRGAPRVEGAALLVRVGKGGEALREVACVTDQGECWSVVWKEHETQVQWSHLTEDMIIHTTYIICPSVNCASYDLTHYTAFVAQPTHNQMK